MYYIPSIQKEINFKPLTIGQLTKILNAHNNYPVACLGFNLAVIQTFEQNCLEEIVFTDFDKHAIFVQTCLNDLEYPGQFNKNIQHPEHSIISFDSYNIELVIPTSFIEKEYCLFLMKQTTNFSDIFLLTEITKYIQKINNIDINKETSFDKKINILQTLPINILTEIVKYIDNYKLFVNDYYKQMLGEGTRYTPDLLIV